MENKFNFNSAICTSRSQSEKLLALGLKKETADCALFLNGNNEFEQLSKFGNWEKYADMLPAWSLHRLVELIWGDGEHDMSLETHRPFEDCIERIDYMINQSHCFNKEYLV